MPITLVTILAVSGVVAPLDHSNDVAQMLATAKRLYAATAEPTGLHSKYLPIRPRLDALIRFLERGSQRQLEMSRPFEAVNLLYGIRDMVDMGSQTTLLPEERLAWVKVGLDLTRALNRSLAQRSVGGVLPDEVQIQFDERIKSLQIEYAKSLKQCISD